MNVASISPNYSFDRNSRQFTSDQQPLESAPSESPDDEVSLRSNRTQSRQTVRNYDEALLLVSSLRAGIFANRGDALSAQANQASDGLADLLSR